MKSLFLACFFAVLAACCFMVMAISVVLVIRPASEWWTIALFVVPNAIFLAFATREMLRTFRRVGRKTVTGQETSF